MEPEDVLKLQEVRPELCRELEFELVAPALLQHKLITTQEYEEVSNTICKRQQDVCLGEQESRWGAGGSHAGSPARQARFSVKTSDPGPE